MSDTEDDDNFQQAFKGFGEDPAPVTPPVVDSLKEDPVKEEPKTDEEPPQKTPETQSPTPADDKKEEEKPKSSAPPETPPTVPEAPKVPEEKVEPVPLTKDDVTAIISNLRNEERSSTKELETTTEEVLEAFYPDGLSNTLTTPEGKALKTPQDVVDASNGQMTTEEAAQWLMNEQYKLDQDINKIKNDAKRIAETTVNFKRDSVAAVQKYEPLFKKYPHLQQKVFDKLIKQVKYDKDKGVILSAPDVLEHYDDYLEPYQLAFEHSTQQSATNPTAPTTPEPPKPTAEDRMDEGGDGGTTPPNDPNDFAQQVSKELAKGI